jgi:chloramphenicol 3-O phosphotransferase
MGANETLRVQGSASVHPCSRYRRQQHLFDHIIETQAALHELLSLIAELDVFFFGLHCSLPELERREIQCSDRRRGEAQLDLQTVHNITSYDLELNSENPLDENIAVLLRAWRERKRPSALDRMIQEMNLEDHERFL